jgi:murein L,D-transpeptidase YcbB/YkuD
MKAIWRLATLKTDYFLPIGVCSMQSSISAVEVFISNTTKLFFSSKDALLKSDKIRRTPRKNLIISTLCLMPLSMTVQAITEDVTTPTTNVAVPAISATPETKPVEAINEINNIIAAKTHPYLALSNFTHRAEDLDALYKASGYQPIWLSDANKAQKNIGEVVKLLQDASSYGLNAANYDTQLLQEKLSALKPPFDVHSKDLALYDTAISLSLLRFLHDLHYGRINPNDLNFNIQLRTEKTLDLPTLISSSLAQDSLSALPSLVEPKLQQYQKLKQALIAYRAAEKAQPSFKLLAKLPIQLGNPLPQSAELQHFLVAFGDLPADKVDNSSVIYTQSIADGVKNFQKRHGIAVNGVINKATAAALNEPLSQRAMQIELAMERLRWLPEITEGRAVIVNIPAFQLSAFDDITQDTPTKTMRVVVGKAAKNKTPLLTAEMRFVDFQPYWNVPFKIARDEILPKLAQNPGYLSGQNMELISRSGRKIGGDAGESFAEQIRQGSMGIRQRPGKGNALGKVKFIFPNKSDVYLHDTPSVSLFSRSRRDLSHGCVRVAQPEELANFVLKDQDGWNADSIKKALKSAKNQRVILKNTIPVLFLYNTAFFDEHNNLAFYPDIYHHDATLLEALKKQDDLSDKVLFAPKEVIPPTDEQKTDQIEATTPIDSVNTANAKQVTSALQPVAAANTTQAIPVLNPEKHSTSSTDSTVSP